MANYSFALVKTLALKIVVQPAYYPKFVEADLAKPNVELHLRWPSLRPLLDWLRKASSMALAETEAVQANKLKSLQVTAISDLVTLSTDPRVCSIGLQALGGLYNDHIHPLNDNLRSWPHLSGLVTDFIRDQLFHHPTMDSAARERVLRGALFKLLDPNTPDHAFWKILHGNRLNFSEWPITHQQQGVILALAAQRTNKFYFRSEARTSLAIWVTRTPFEELQQMPLWDLLQIGTAFEVGSGVPSYLHRLADKVKNGSYDQNIDADTALKARQTFLHPFNNRLLRFIADHVVNTVHEQEVDQAFRFLSDMLSHRVDDNELFEIPESVLATLTQTVTPSLSSVQATASLGNFLLRLGVITEVHTLASPDVITEQMFTTVLYSMLILTSPGAAENPHIQVDDECPQYTKELIMARLKKIFIDYCTSGRNPRGSSPSDQGPKFHFCPWLIRKEKCDVSVAFLQDLPDVVHQLVSQSSSWVASYGLDSLFRYLVDPLRDHWELYSSLSDPCIRELEEKLLVLTNTLDREIRSHGNQPWWDALLRPWHSLIEELFLALQRSRITGSKTSIAPEPKGEDETLYFGNLLQRLKGLRDHYPPVDGVSMRSDGAPSCQQFVDLDADVQEYGPALYSFVKSK